MPQSRIFKVMGGALLTLALCAYAYLMLCETYRAGYDAGLHKINAEWQTERQKLQAKVNDLTKQVAALQHHLDTQTTEFERKTHEEKQALITDYERRLAASHARIERVYIPARIPEGYCDSAHAGASTVTLRKTRCELEPEIVERLAGIAQDGDMAIIERNELIDRYNAARAALIRQKQLETAP